MELISKLIHDDWDRVPKNDWHHLGSVLEKKQAYVNTVVESIDADTFKDTKAKTPEEREIKIANKIEEAKQVLQERIVSFKTLIDNALTNMLNCEKEASIQ